MIIAGSIRKPLTVTSTIDMSRQLENPYTLPLRVLLTALYAAASGFRNLAYDRGWFKTFAVDLPVVSVGNITVGGSGKTLLVEAIARYLLEKGRHPSILSRGYGRMGKALQVVSDGSDIFCHVRRAGDEPFLLASHLPMVPVVVCRDRVAGAHYLQNVLETDIIILDDGFQHRRLERDLDIVILDRTEAQPGNLLPWGPLRESPRGLKRAHVLVYSKLPPGEQPVAGEELVFSYPEHLLDADDNPIPRDRLPAQTGVFSGLGNPDYFVRVVREKVLEPSEVLEFPDHCRYEEKDRIDISSGGASAWITTAKDAVKLEPEFRRQENIYVLPVSVNVPDSIKTHLDEL